MAQSASTGAIQQLYIAYMGRPADPAGLQFWQDLVDKNLADMRAISDAFANSNEYKALVAGKSTSVVVENIYMQLFGRKPDAGGLAFWANQLDSGKLPISTACSEIMRAAQGSDMTTVNLKINAANEFTSSLANVNLVKDFSPSEFNKIAHTLLTSVTDVSSYTSFLLKMKYSFMSDLVHAGIAVGEPNPNGNGVAVGEPNPNDQGVAVGEPNPSKPGQGIAVGEPHPTNPVQGIAIGEPNPGHLSIDPGMGLSLMGVPELHLSFM
jgi:hypothetical protein